MLLSKSKIIETCLQTPIGTLIIRGTVAAVTNIYFSDQEIINTDKNISGEVENCRNQMQDYFNNKLTVFTLKIQLQGTDFQLKVWEELRSIPYGKHLSYTQLALQLGDKKLLRAVGGANGQNPLALVVPCHRVIGAKGSLVGYAGGVWRKQWLLEHENNAVINYPRLF